MKEIKLANDERTFVVDDIDYERISKFKWFLLKHKNSLQIIRTKTVCYRTKNYNLGSEILNTSHKVDHIDRSVFNNVRLNLRLANRSQNGANREKNTGNYTSKYKGVRRVKTGWEARICKNQVSYQIGTFANEEDAAKAYNKKAVELFGEFACTNPV